MDTLSDCLTAPDSAVREGRLPFDKPNRVFWLEPGRSPCGTYPAPGASAFYCPANNTMYVGLQNVVETSGGEPLSHYAVYARVIAHEYGHHVQDRAGILLYGDRQMESGDIATRTEASRRIELQAQCFARRVPRQRARHAADDARAVRRHGRGRPGRGDEDQPPEKRDHGSGRHYAGWVITGYNGRDLTVCNTWTAPSSKVS